MQENTLILSEYEEINASLYEPIITTQRIKYTCMNVSLNYIILGSTSGSLYLFIREPCIFQQVIPLSEGPVVHVVISPDEKTVALATKRGSVCLINLKPVIKLLSVLNEHIDEIITCLCWNEKSTEVYVGDSNGKISTIVLSIFAVNRVFQPPSCPLMHLDSSIVQMDFSMHYLLISTLTRCYICDTAQEQFKQIGNKTRDGEFGACFFKVIDQHENNSILNVKNEKIITKTNGFDLTNGTNDEQQNLMVYCARPGCRLWEVMTSGIVTKTHQFKDALSISSSKIHVASTIKSSCVKINNKSDQQRINPNQTHNFSRLLVLDKKYLLSYTLNRLYIIDPVNATVILWCDEFTDIAMTQIVDDKIYLMTMTGVFHHLTLSNVDSLIVKLFRYRLYNDCLKLCTIYHNDLLKLVGDNQLMKMIENELELDTNNSQEHQPVATLQLIISTIQPDSNIYPQKLDSGIVLVNSGNEKLQNKENCRSLTPSETEKELTPNNCDENDKSVKCESKLTLDSDIFRDNSIELDGYATNKINEPPHNQNNIQNLEDNISQINLNDCNDSIRLLRNDDSIDTPTEENQNEMQITATNIQSDLEPVHILIEAIKLSITENNMEKLADVLCRINKNISEINYKYRHIDKLKQFLYEIIRSIERHYYRTLLENITVEVLSSIDNSYVINETVEAFLDVNGSNYAECTCGNPRANDEQLTEPKLIQLGQALVQKFLKENNNEKLLVLVKCMPYFWRENLAAYIEKRDIIDDDIIRLCLQTQDNIILSILLPQLNAKHWEIAVECIENLQSHLCLFCKKNSDALKYPSFRIDWNEVIIEILSKGTPNSTLEFLTLFESKLPTIKLKPNIYQSLIYTKILNRYGLNHTIKLDDELSNNKFSSVSSPQVKDRIVEALEQDTKKSINKNVFGNGAYHWGMRYNMKSSACPACTLALQTPVLLGNNGIAIFPCGHAYHANCLVEKNLKTCFLHQ